MNNVIQFPLILRDSTKEVCRINADGSYYITEGLEADDYMWALNAALDMIVEKPRVEDKEE